MSINWDEFKCRASAVNRMMAESRSNPQLTLNQVQWLKDYEARTKEPSENIKAEYARLMVIKSNQGKIILSDGYIQYLMEVYAWETEGMIAIGKEGLDTLAMSKGRKQEPVAKELLELVDGCLYKIHKERISNAYLSGEIDLYLGQSVYEAENVTDLKNAEDYVKFLRKVNNGIERGQREQVATYCDITTSPVGFIANTCVDFPEEDIVEMEMKLIRKLGCISTESPEFVAEWPKWERSMRVSHIAPAKRVYKIPVELFSESEKQSIYDKVKVGRDFLWKFDEERQKLN